MMAKMTKVGGDAHCWSRLRGEVTVWRGLSWARERKLPWKPKVTVLATKRGLELKRVLSLLAGAEAIVGVRPR